MANNQIEVHITAENEQFVNKMKEIVAAIKSVDSQAAASSANMRSSMSGDNLFDGFLGGLAKAELATQALVGALTTVKDITESIVAPGLDLSKTMESAQLGLAGIISSMGKLNGEAIAFPNAMDMASNVIDQLQKDAIRTSATFKDLITVYQGILAPGLGAGMDLNQIEQFAVVGTNSVKAMGLNGTQFVQELRDLVQGGIQASSSTLATALGLTDEDIKDAKNSAQGLFAFLMERIQGMEPMMERFPDTLAGKFSMLEEAATYTSKAITDQFGGDLKSTLDTVTGMLGDMNTQTGTFDINPAFFELLDRARDNLTAIEQNAQDMLEIFGDFDVDNRWYPSEETVDLFNQVEDVASDFVNVLIDGAPIAAEISSEILRWVDALLNVVDTLEGYINPDLDSTQGEFTDVKTAIDFCVDALVGMMIISKITAAVETLATAFGVVRAAVVEVRKAIQAASAAQAVLNILTAGPNLAKVAIATAGIGVAVGAGLALQNKMDAENSADEEREKLRQQERKAFSDYNKQVRDEKRSQQSGSVTSKFPKVDKDAVKKAQREQLQANKQALQQQTELIKANLDAQLEAIKDTMESIQLAFDQARIGWAEYGTEKAQSDAQQEQARIDAIKQQMDAVQDSGAYKTQDEMNTALNKLQVELEKHERALEKLTAVQEDVANVIAAYKNQPVTPNLDAQKAQQGQMVPEGSSNSEAALYLAYQAVKGLDKTGQLTYDVLLGMAQQESSLAHWDENGNVKTSADGGIGLMQLTSDYAKGLAGDPYDLYKNALGGAKYLVGLLNQYGDLHTALARYNGSGPTAEVYANSVLGYAQEENARATYLLNQPQVGSGYGATSAVSGGILQGIGAGFQAWENQTMENMRVGCVEAVKKIGSWYSQFLAQEATNNVPQLQKDAAAAGIPEIGYDEGKLKPGDVIVYDGNEHVLIYKGNGRTVGNSSSALDSVYGKGQGPGKVIEQGIDIGMTPTSIIQTGTYGVAPNLANTVDYDPKTAEGEKLKKKALEDRKRAQDALKQYQELYGDISTVPIEQLIQQVRETQKQLKANGHSKEAEELNIVLAAKQNELEFKTQSNYLKTAMNVIQDNAADMVYKIGDSMYNAADMAKKYLGYINGANYPGGQFDIKSIFANFQKELKKAEAVSDMSSMAEITKAIKSVQDNLVKMVKDFQQTVEDQATWRSNMVDANYNLSAGQKDRAKQKVERDKQAELDRSNRAIADFYYQQQLTVTDPNQQQSLVALSDHYAKLAALNEELAKTPTLLAEVGKTAKDSLENGLVTFLTDGIDKAGSLADALRDMATSFLKDLQKLFANKIVDELMDHWYPQRPNTGNATTAGYNMTQNLSQQLGPLGNQLAITPSSLSISAAPLQAAMQQAGTQLSTTTTNFTSIATAAASNFAISLQNIASKVINGLQNATSILSLNSAVSGSDNSKYVFGTPDIMSGFNHRATGGLMDGPGTDTSDNIPTMLSPGEFVVRAKAVRKYGVNILKKINEGRWGNMNIHIPKFAQGGYIGDTGSSAINGVMDRFALNINNSSKPPIVNTHVQNVVDSKKLEGFITTTVVKNSKLYNNLFKRR